MHNDSFRALPHYPSNIGRLLRDNATRYNRQPAFCTMGEEEQEQILLWDSLYTGVVRIAAALYRRGFRRGDRMLLFSRNGLDMLQLELAVMAMGGIAIPIFAFFKKPTSDLLIQFADARWMAIEGIVQLAQISEESRCANMFVFDTCQMSLLADQTIEDFQSLRLGNPDDLPEDWDQVDSDSVCLCMYTSGTMGVPKLVQLTHRNILSQQAAIKEILNLTPEDRFLSYLPWHHSFGGIFELFGCLYNGACYTLESSFGKNTASILKNWKSVRPTVFFSVPRVYQQLVEEVRKVNQSEGWFFHERLRFIFTAAASLPMWLTEVFDEKHIPVIEGWGLTETSPCCTLTDPNKKRMPGLVGHAIPGTSLKIADDGEILVKGPNVMVGYYNNPEANERIFTSDGWFRTGDIGTMTKDGLKLVTRKDRIFKLSNGEKVIPTELELAIEKQCHYVQYVLVSGSGCDYPVALIFPNKNLFDHPDYRMTPEQGCFCPRNLNELGKCLTGCLRIANDGINQKFSKLQSAAIIMDELKLEDQTITPSLKLAPGKVLEKYRHYINSLYGGDFPKDQEVYVIEL